MNSKIDLDGMIKDYKESTLDEVFVEEVLDDLNNLKKFYKPVVPQFVADWYEENEDDLETAIFRYTYTIDKQPYSLFKEWFTDTGTDAFHTLINMHQFGYEVKKEKKYLVKVKSLDTNFSFLNFNKVHNHWMFSSVSESDVYQVYHTRKELEEAGFGWVFNCEGVEVEEVTE